MVEVEVKARGELGRVREALLELGAEAQGAGEEWDLYFNAPDRDFSKTDEALRIRVRGGRGVLTYKGPKLDRRSKSRREVEVEVGDWEAMRELLGRLGYREVTWVRKVRERYRLGAFTVSLDKVEGLGEFVEVEAKAEGPYGDLLDEAFRLLERLGLAPEEAIRTSYLEMLLQGGPGR